MKNIYLLFICLIIIICSICTKAYTNEIFDKFTQEDIIYFNNLKNCTPTYINENGTSRRIIGLESGACIFKENILSNPSKGTPGISLSCKMPKTELSTMVINLLHTLQSDGSVSESAKIKYQQAIQQYCDFSIQQ